MPTGKEIYAYVQLAQSMDLCGDTIVRDVGLPTSSSEYLQQGSEAINRLVIENNRLRGALEDIAKAYPCGDMRSMRRLAAETIGLSIKLPTEDP